MHITKGTAGNCRQFALNNNNNNSNNNNNNNNNNNK